MSNKRRNKKHRLLDRRKMKETVAEQESVWQEPEKENADSVIPVFQERGSAGQTETPEVSTPAEEVSETPDMETVKPEETSVITPDAETVEQEETSVPKASVSPELPAPQPPASQPEEPAQPLQKEIEKNLYLQYNNLEFSDHLMFEAAVNDYCRKTGTPVEEIQAVNLYVKPEEGKAYYVINHDGEKLGSIDL